MRGVYEADGGYVLYLTSKYLKADVLERFESETDAKKALAAVSKRWVWGQSLPVNSLPYTDLPGIYSKDPQSSGKSLLSRMKVPLVSVRDTVKNWLARLQGKVASKGDGLQWDSSWDWMRLMSNRGESNFNGRRRGI